MRSLYPAMGAGIGGGLGSIAGPGGAVAGGAGGAAVGQIMKGDGDVARIVETVEQISKGDVEGLIKSQILKERTFVDTMIDGLKSLLLWTAIGCGLLFFVPILHSRWVHRKTVEKISNGQSPPGGKENNK